MRIAEPVAHEPSLDPVLPHEPMLRRSVLREQVLVSAEQEAAGAAGGVADLLAQLGVQEGHDRLHALDEKQRGDAEFLKQEFRSLFAGKYETRKGTKRPREELRWSRFRHLPAEEMLDHVRR